MRILLLSNLYPPQVEGGAELLAGEIADGMLRLGHDVHVLCGSNGSSYAPTHPQVRRTLQLAQAARLDRRRQWWRQLSLLRQYYRGFHSAANARELRRAIAEIQPDVLYVWEITGLGINSLLAELPVVRAPVVFHLGSYWLLYARSPETAHSRFHARWLKRWLIGAVPPLTATSLIAVSATVKQAYVEAGCDPQRIEVIYNGIGSRFLDSAPNPSHGSLACHGSRPMRLLCVGRLCPEKGILTVLKALDALAADPDQPGASYAGYHLDIIGDGDAAYVRELQSFMRARRLTERVTFRGRLAQDALIAFYDQADVLLNASLWQEPFGLTTIEAMARGLPVIGSRVGGTAEIVMDDINGMLTEPGDEYALASAIRRLASDPQRRTRLSRAAQETVRERFTLDENARRVACHLQRAVDGELAAVAPDSDATPRSERSMVL